MYTQIWAAQIYIRFPRFFFAWGSFPIFGVVRNHFQRWYGCILRFEERSMGNVLDPPEMKIQFRFL
jgi:hypothetical protein